MPLDPAVLNCAAEVCCGSEAALAARVEALELLGCETEEAKLLAVRMAEEDVAMVPGSLAREIAKFVDHPNKRRGS